MPPDAASWVLYAAPTVPFGKDAVVIVTGAAVGPTGEAVTACAMYVSTLHPVMPSFQLTCHQLYPEAFVEPPVTVPTLPVASVPRTVPDVEGVWRMFRGPEETSTLSPVVKRVETGWACGGDGGGAWGRGWRGCGRGAGAGAGVGAVPPPIVIVSCFVTVLPEASRASKVKVLCPAFLGVPMRSPVL